MTAHAGDSAGPTVGEIAELDRGWPAYRLFRQYESQRRALVWDAHGDLEFGLTPLNGLKRGTIGAIIAWRPTRFCSVVTLYPQAGRVHGGHVSMVCPLVRLSNAASPCALPPTSAATPGPRLSHDRASAQAAPAFFLVLAAHMGEPCVESAGVHHVCHRKLAYASETLEYRCFINVGLVPGQTDEAVNWISYSSFLLICQNISCRLRSLSVHELVG
jgi:hypothetical protein